MRFRAFWPAIVVFVLCYFSMLSFTARPANASGGYVFECDARNSLYGLISISQGGHYRINEDPDARTEDRTNRTVTLTYDDRGIAELRSRLIQGRALSSTFTPYGLRRLSYTIKTDDRSRVLEITETREFDVKELAYNLWQLRMLVPEGDDSFRTENYEAFEKLTLRYDDQGICYIANQVKKHLTVRLIGFHDLADTKEKTTLDTDLEFCARMHALRSTNPTLVATEATSKEVLRLIALNKELTGSEGLPYLAHKDDPENKSDGSWILREERLATAADATKTDVVRLVHEHYCQLYNAE
ncbi:MAG: hypothetical protein AB1540_15740, partial [Bdellovibrionota bacterium]